MPVRQLIGTRTARYQAVPSKSAIDDQLREKEEGEEEGEKYLARAALPRFPCAMHHIEWVKILFPSVWVHCRPSGYASNHMENPHLDAFSGVVIKQPTGEAAASGQSLQFNTHPRSIPFPASDSSIASSQTSSGSQDVQLSLLKAHEDVIRSQIQFLQTQLHALEQQATYRPETPSGDVVPAVADLKGKSVITSDAATSKPDGAHQEDSEKV
ncbi:hypothetical protein B296_00055559 [Ensete ventricosum]|uniref:Uncharacterized protein n=1 Tax=Ensete ventricosum TaxID=4639 RepID=A0A426XAD0_ENSVE|nr:hypothetical protein B296_00055559 [Ensete ventricosum]